MTLRTDIARTWTLAWPVFLSHLVVIGVSTIDTIMVGRAATEELSYLGVGRVFFWVASVVPQGLLSGIVVYASQADGAGKQRDCGQYWRQGVLYAGLIAAVAAAAMVFLGAPVLRASGLSDDMVAAGADYLRITAIGIPFYLVTITTFLFFEGISRPRVGTIILVSTLPINAAMNWVFIYGNLGMPEMGASGAALGTAMAYIAGMVMALTYVLRFRDRAHFGFDLSFHVRKTWREGRKLRLFGLVPGLAYGMDVLGFGTLSLMAGHLGHEAVGALQAVIMLHALSFALPIGFANAGGVRVGNAMGRRDANGVKRATLVAAGLAVVVLMPFVAMLLLAPDFALGLISSDPALIEIGRGMLYILAPFLFFDGAQFVLLFALRSMEDQRIASILQIASMFGVMVGLGWVAIFVLDMGANGLSLALAGGLVAAFLLLGARTWIMFGRLQTKLN